MQGSKGLANYISKCKSCDRTSSIEFIDGSLKAYEDQNGQFQTIAIFECRGMEPCEFFPGNSFSAASAVSENVWGSAGGGEPLDLTEGDWAAYDEDAEESVTVYEFKSQFIRS